MPPNAGLALRDPLNAPASNAAFVYRRTYRPNSMVRINGRTGRTAPSKKMVMPLDLTVTTACRPEFNPTTATNAASPKSFNNCDAADGITPYIGCLPRIQPNTSPASRQPPPEPSVNGTPPTVTTINPSSKPITIPTPI